MIRLFFVGDGPRDEATVPHLVERLLGTSFDVRTAHWARLSYGAQGTRRTRNKGYTAKVLYALRQARDACADGLIATVDADAKRSHRLKALKAGRDADRAERAPLPAALGEAVPHGEAWLLDDAEAVRQALRLETSEKIPSLKRTSNPKQTLEELISGSARSDDTHIDVLRDIAVALDPDRCKSRKTSGFDAFVKDVHAELDPLVRETG